MKAKHCQGQSLIEMLLALAVTVLVVIALVRATTNAVRNADFAKNKALAVKYAQEWLEEARNWRDSDATGFFVDGSCNAGDKIGTLDMFSRQRTCSLIDSTMTVSVTVDWETGGKSHQTNLQTKLTNWK